MPIFPEIDVETIVQSKDKTRLDASRSFVSGGNTIATIKIQPSATADEIDVTETGYLDWAYTHSGGDDDPEEITVTVTVTDSEGDEESTTAVINVVTEDTDHLFSDDDMLRKHESNIMKYLADGRSSFKDVHRRSQTLILAWLDTQGFIDDIGDKITLDRLVNTSEVSEWSTMMTLRLIFEDIRNAVDDVFAAKVKKYEGLEAFYRNRAVLRIDLNDDGVAENTEGLDIRSCRVIRR